MVAQWNEIPASTGEAALSRTYPAGYRTDVIDVPVQGELEVKSVYCRVCVG
jgi:hypothetical protein